MKKIKLVGALGVAVMLAAILTAGCDRNQKVEAGKPYPLPTCLVCGMKLADMGKPYVFVYQGQEIKVCDKSEKTDFDKEPGKYLKKLSEK